MGKLFGTDGIRGEANRYPMNAEIAFRVGQAVAHLIQKRQSPCPRDYWKRYPDFRIHAGELAGSRNHVHGGIPYLVGVLPTPGIAFITQSMRADAGIVISASHNPFQDNGLKIFGWQRF